MVKEIILDGCKCTCDAAREVVTQSVRKGLLGTGLGTALEAGLVVLVIILVILALVIGFNKLKQADEDNEEDEYY